jgi:hypothetical protein
MNKDEIAQRKYENSQKGWLLIDRKEAAIQAGDADEVAAIDRLMDEVHRELREIESDENVMGHDDPQ